MRGRLPGLDRLRDDRSRPAPRRAHRGCCPGHQKPLSSQCSVTESTWLSSHRSQPWIRWTTSSAPCTPPRACSQSSTAESALVRLRISAPSYVRQFVAEPRRRRWPGTRWATDRGFLARDMPTLEGHLHYRWSMYRASRSWPSGGIRGRNPTPRARPGTTGHSPTSRRASRSCATTAKPSSCCPQGQLGDSESDRRRHHGTPRRLDRAAELPGETRANLLMPDEPGRVVDDDHRRLLR